MKKVIEWNTGEELLNHIQELIDLGRVNKETLKFEENKLSDGYHTFDELYEFRLQLQATLFNEWAKEHYIDEEKRLAEKQMGFDVPNFKPKYDVHKSLKHHDGEDCFGGGWFIVVAVLPTGQISNHYKLKDWDLFQIPEVPRAKYEFDGHTGADVLERLKSLNRK